MFQTLIFVNKCLAEPIQHKSKNKMVDCLEYLHFQTVVGVSGFDKALIQSIWLVEWIKFLYTYCCSAHGPWVMAEVRGEVRFASAFNWFRWLFPQMSGKLYLFWWKDRKDSSRKFDCERIHSNWIWWASNCECVHTVPCVQTYPYTSMLFTMMANHGKPMPRNVCVGLSCIWMV